MAGIRLRHEEFLSRCMIHKNSVNYDFSKTVYTNSRTSVEVECKKHGKFTCSPSSMMSGFGCNICDRMTGHNTKTHLTLDEYKEIATMLHDGKYDYSLINELADKIQVICPEHGQFLIRRSAHISKTQMYGCQQCGNLRSLGEERIIKFLKKFNINYTYQKTFDWGRSIGHKQPLRYDFYIQSLNLLIEFDGKHHTEPTRYGGQSLESATKQTKRTKFYDGIKTMNAVLSKIRIIRISYKRIKDIETILYDELQQLDKTLLGIYE